MEKSIIPVNATGNIYFFNNIKFLIATLSVVWHLQNIHMGQQVKTHKCAIPLTILAPPESASLPGNRIDQWNWSFRGTCRDFPPSYLRLGGPGARRLRRATARRVKQKLTSVQERSDEEGAHAAGGQQVHPCESLRSTVGAVGFGGLIEPLG